MESPDTYTIGGSGVGLAASGLGRSRYRDRNSNTVIHMVVRDRVLQKGKRRSSSNKTKRRFLLKLHSSFIFVKVTE